MKPVIIVHGGAGEYIPDSLVQGRLDGSKAAAIKGYEILAQGGTALDAVEAAVVLMEEDENFNAGHGESNLKYCLAHSIIKLMETGLDASTSTKKGVEDISRRLNNTAGAISISKNGDYGLYLSRGRMSWACVKDGTLSYGIEKDECFSEKYD